MELEGNLIRIEDVTPDQRDQMFALMQRYYENATRDAFETDLADKDWVIVARRQADDKIFGFSTQKLITPSIGAVDTEFLFSGDTIIDPLYWGKNPLARVWGRLALSLIEQRPDSRLFWFLISKGYKTYRFLPVFFEDFYPRFDRATPPRIATLIRSVARLQFPNQFDEQAGIIRAKNNACRLRGGVATVTKHRLSDPHVRFFCERNPGYGRGDELCCLAPLTRENLKSSAYRVIGTSQGIGL